MAIARRDLLCIGAAVVLSGAVSSCSDARVNPDRAARPSRRPTRGQPSPPSTFAGHPPPGQVYYGASLPADRSLKTWETSLGSSLALNRSYFTPDPNETAQLVQRCGDDLAHGRLPHVSIKPAGTWRDIATGAWDDWLLGMLGPLGRERGPIFFTLNHEPENDAGPDGMQPADFVAMQGRLITLAADLAPNVTIIPVLQHWTFDPMRDDVDPSVWIVADAAVVGLDVYNPWSPANGKPWRSFGSKVDEVIGWFGDTPLAIGEYGCREDPQSPGLAAGWLRDAADYARTHNIVSMSYFNSDVGAPDGSWVLRQETEPVFAELLAADWVARPG